jgi:chemotaxis protein CheX
MDVSYVNPFIIETRNCFKTMLDIELQTGKPALSTEAVHTYDISGVIGLNGQAQGIISISYPKIVALRVVSALLGSDIKIVGPELIDGIGEITNIIAGNAKKHLSHYNLAISLPNVVIGKGHRIEIARDVIAIIVPLSAAIGSIAMEVALKTP